MDKLVLLYLLVIFPITLLSQQNYPIQTILKGDSVVIYTIEQNDDIEILLANQRSRVAFYKNNITKKQAVIDSLNLEMIKQQTKQQKQQATCISKNSLKKRCMNVSLPLPPNIPEKYTPTKLEF